MSERKFTLSFRGSIPLNSSAEFECKACCIVIDDGMELNEIIDGLSRKIKDYIEATTFPDLPEPKIASVEFILK